MLHCACVCVRIGLKFGIVIEWWRVLTSRLRIIAANVGQRADNGQLSSAVLFVLLVEMAMASEKSLANLFVIQLFQNGSKFDRHIISASRYFKMCIPSLWSWMEGGRNWPSCRWRDRLSGRVSEHRHPAGRVRWAGDCEVRTANGATESLREA